MKLKKIVMGILFATLIIVGIEGMISFWENHSYYTAMILSWKNLALLLSSALAARIPISFITSKKKPTLKKLILGIGAGLWSFSLLHAIFSGGLLTLFAAVPLLFNTFLLYLLAIGFILAVFSLGNFISRKLKLFQKIRWQETLLTFGLGLVTFLLLMQILMGIQLFYSVVNRVIFGGLLVLMRFERKAMKVHEENLISCLESWKSANKASKIWWISVVLLLISFWYYFFNFSHSYIPYSTAWDANHEYMYVPKVIAENAGILWGNIGPANGVQYLWQGYISFFFSLWAPLGNFFNIAKDTVAINLNAFSGVLVLIFWLGVLKEALLVFGRKESSEETDQTSFLVGRGLLLMWLTSGMGAFLVFVDNKTDMGVLALTILALFGGMIFLNHFQKKGIDTDSKQSLKYLILSALFFGFAVMAKPTAFIDVVIFALLLVGFWLNTTTLVGTGIATLGLMGVVQPLFASAFITPELGKWLFAIGIVLAVIGGIRGLISRNDQFSKGFQHIVIWWITLIATLFLFKGPWVLVSSITAGNFQIWTFIKSTLLAQSTSKNQATTNIAKQQPLLAQTTVRINTDRQSDIDRAVLNRATQDLDYQQCLKEANDPQELDSTKQQAPGSSLSEDVGRYVGFGWREFKHTGVGWALLKLAFLKENTCFGWDADGLLLCKNRNLLDVKNLSGIEALSSQLSKNGAAQALVKSLLDAQASWEDLRDEYKALETYYQEHSILTTTGSVFIPYRYIVPLNIVFNRSLQNLSSYYTDIGLIWLCVFVVIGFGLLYAVLSYDRKHKHLLFLSFGTVIGWIIWWAIGGGILWYGLGLVIWSTLTVTALLQEWAPKKESSIEFKTIYGLLVGFLAIFLVIQAFMNGMRIASQAGEWPFEQYKSNVGEKQEFGDKLELKNTISYKFTAKDIFNMQFGQYQPFLEAVKNRTADQGVLIAGTYLQYFLNNQKNLRLDGMLTRLWEELSDFNSCRSYQRLKNEKLKYLIIDPNIGTVGRAGEGNESLFYRFFARLTSDEQHIETHGTISMLVKMAQEGYLKLIFTNNIGAKYAFTLSDEELTSVFGTHSAEDLLLIRAKMAVARFFSEDQDLISKIYALFGQRLPTQKGLWDLANTLQKQVDEEKLYQIFLQMAGGQLTNASSLTQDERIVVSQYYGLIKMLSDKTTVEQGQNVLFNLFQKSLAGSSQIISLELR